MLYGILDASVDALRHTFATRHVKKKTSLRTVQAAVGHESLATTSIYVGLGQEPTRAVSNSKSVGIAQR
jgi:site-specific recombinase XerD